MDIHERQSAEPERTWQLLNFFTEAVCGLGFVGNVSALFVLVRHRKEIAGSRLLLALAVADLGVVLSIALRTLSYVKYGYSQLTLTAEWAFLYWYYCSIYMTVFLSLDRCLSSANPMLLLKIDYSAIQKKVVAAIFSVAFAVTLPHLLGNTVSYHYGLHTLQGPCFGENEVCNIWMNSSESSTDPVPWKVVFSWKEPTFTSVQTIRSKHQNVAQLLDSWCLKDVFPADGNNSACKPFHLQAPKYVPHLVAGLNFRGIKWNLTNTWNIKQIELSVSNSTADMMRHDPDFVKAVYLGIDLLIRYVIPCIALLVINTRLLVAVYRAQKRHKRITGDTSPVSLLDLPVLKSVGVIVVVFSICHAGGMGMYITDIMRVFAGETLADMTGGMATFLDERSATDALRLRYTTYLLAAVNSSVNILIYCFYLPPFRKHWKKMFHLNVFTWPFCKQQREKPQSIFPMEEITNESILAAPGERVHLEYDARKADESTQLFDRMVRHLRRHLSVSQRKIRTLSPMLAVVLFFILIVAGSGRLFLNSTGKDFDPKHNLKPVRYKNLNNLTDGICVSGNWMVVSFWSQHTVRLYSLPGLVPGQEVMMTNPGAPRSSSDGLVYVPNWDMVKELMISQEGGLSVHRNITLHGVRWGIRFVAVGPQTDQLCIFRWSSSGMIIDIVSLGDDVTVQQTLTVSSKIGRFSTISALHTGQVLVTTRNMDLCHCSSALYQEQQMSFLTNLTQESCTSIAYRDHFLVLEYIRAHILILDGQGHLVHIIDYGTGYIRAFRDLAVWQDSVFVVTGDGILLLLSPV